MSINEQQARTSLKRLFQEILNEKKFDLFDDFFDQDLVAYDGKDKYTDRKALRKNIEERSKAVPDLKYIIDDIIINGNKAAIRWHSRGNAISEFSSFKAGAPANYWGVSMCEFNGDGKIIKAWETSSVADDVPEN